jgi:hypothetical protein
MSPEIYAEWGEITREGWTTILDNLDRELGECIGRNTTNTPREK